jgi:hypothetical protein
MQLSFPSVVMLRPSTIKEAPTLERILLMLIRAEETHARPPEKTRRVDSHEVGQEHYEDEANNNEQSIFGFGRSQKRMAVCDFIAAQKDTEDQNSSCDERQTNKRTLPSSKTAHHFSAAPRADTRILRNLRVAMWAYQGLHRRIITLSVSEYERISRATLLPRFEFR